ncbi:methyl-accepting chemotaxis protein [Clostridium intestinale]|uniref:MCP four helix bundle domain-containing protein n=1 Tax=Clostridium intestinale TaxID=36845 RepID=A0A7D7A1R9_9CLOT|nr:methyl-accepting chemotaxis protein [Clostridium intestinale]QLY81035.1 MCP four helix bundle domain-containing protein [Clostridium intestinale]
MRDKHKISNKKDNFKRPQNSTSPLIKTKENKFYKSLETLSIKTILRSISTIAVIFILIIGFIGYTNIQKINTYQNEIYNNNLIPITSIQNIESSILKTKIASKEIISNYTIVKESELSTLQSNITKNMDTFSKNIKMDETENKLYASLTQSIDSYFLSINNSINKLKNSKELNQDEINLITSAEDNILENIKTLKNYEINSADELNKNGENTYKRTSNAYLILLVIIVIVGYLTTVVFRKLVQHMSRNIYEKVKILSSGDFTVQFDTHSNNEFGLVSRELHKSIEAISQMLNKIKAISSEVFDQSSSLSAISEEMNSSAEQVSSAIEGVADGATNQSQELMNTSELLNHFSNNMNSILTSIHNVDEKASVINKEISLSNEDLSILLNSIHKITFEFNEVSKKILALGNDISQINNITDIIQDIADQTNLLSLNAMIESARAGEAGRGFAVVADEIRKLAEQTKTSSKNINDLVGSVSSEADLVINTTNNVNSTLKEQLTIVKKSTDSFKSIIDSFSNMLPEIKSIANQASIIDTERNSIITNVDSASSISEENSASAEEISASISEMNKSSYEVALSSQKLTEITQEMINRVNTFKLS